MPFRLKFTILFLFLLVFSLGIIYLWMDAGASDLLLNLFSRELQEHAEILIPRFDLSDPRVDEQVDRVASEVSYRISLIDPGGTVIADSSFSGPDLRGLENHSNRKEIIDAVSQGTGRSLRYSTSSSEFQLYVAVALPGGQGVLRVSRSLTSIERLMNSLRRSYAYLAIALVLLGMTSILLLSRGLSRSINSLTEAAGRMADGEYVSSIPVGSGDEVGNVARKLEQISSGFEKQVAMLESERNHLSAILDSMTEGVLVTDAQARVTATNSSFQGMFSPEPDHLGRMAIEVVRDPEVSDGIGFVLENGEGRERELKIAERSFLARFAPIGATKPLGGVVVVFHDITELRRLESLRKDFVSNVSHELKTPLTSIQGYAETLLEEDLDTIHRGFVERIYRNSSQLSAMIEDLFGLSRLESGAQQFNWEPVSYSRLMREIQEDFTSELDEKQLGFSFENRSASDIFLAGRGYIERVFRNLIENSVKYTDQGSIVVRLRSTETELQFCVEDTGIGIPKDDLERVFERFYRVDKDRARATGGSGIGLAIAKHIVQLHGGRVWAESEVDKGTRVCFTLPRKNGSLGEQQD
jgi:two-component system phosphate regulon sensor histidine kinase PhoR